MKRDEREKRSGRDKTGEERKQRGEIGRKKKDEAVWKGKEEMKLRNVEEGVESKN